MCMNHAYSIYIYIYKKIDQLLPKWPFDHRIGGHLRLNPWKSHLKHLKTTKRVTWKILVYMGISKNSGKTTKMDRLYDGNPYEQIHDLGGKTTHVFGNTHMYIFQQRNPWTLQGLLSAAEAESHPFKSMFAAASEVPWPTGWGGDIIIDDY